MTLSEISYRLEAAEQRCRYYDAAEGRQWAAEAAPRALAYAERDALLAARRTATHGPALGG